MYLDKEVAKKLVLLSIENKENALNMIDDVIEVIKKFNGKVLNKRLETSLRKNVCDDIFVRCGSILDIYISMFNNRSVQNTPDLYGYSNTVYLKDGDYYISFCYGNIDDFVTEDKRLNAVSIIENIENKRKNLHYEINELREKLEKVEEYKTKLENLRTEIANIEREIPCQLKEYFDLK